MNRPKLKTTLIHKKQVCVTPDNLKASSHLTVYRFAGRRRWRGPSSAAVGGGFVDGGRFAGGFGGHAGGPVLLCGHWDIGGGRLCEVARRAGRSEAPEISSLGKQTSVNSLL